MKNGSDTHKHHNDKALVTKKGLKMVKLISTWTLSIHYPTGHTLMTKNNAFKNNHKIFPKRYYEMYLHVCPGII